MNKYRREPVLMLFIDPPLQEMKGLKDLSQHVRENFIQRWKRFAPDNRPVFYGNWVRTLAHFDERSKYPKCFYEKSRDQSMKIIYMDIGKMIPFPNVESLKAFIQSYTTARDVNEFMVFDDLSSVVIKDPDDLLKDC